jgi:hypothetical protein
MISGIREDAAAALAFVSEVLGNVPDDETNWLLTQAVTHLEAIIAVCDDD